MKFFVRFGAGVPAVSTRPALKGFGLGGVMALGALSLGVVALGPMASGARAQEAIVAPLPAPESGQVVLEAAAPKPVSAWTDDEVRALGQSVAFPHYLLDGVLSRAVNREGAIDYPLMRQDRDLALYLRALALADLANFPVWRTKDDKGQEVADRGVETAFWINAHNALFIHAVASAYPVGSVTAVPNLASAPRLVGGREISLGAIRQKLTELEPRALFVLLDGTRQGPRSPQSAMRSFDLGQQLNAAISTFVNDPSRVSSPNRSLNIVAVSPWLESVDAAFAPSSGRRRRHEGIRFLLSAYTTNNVDKRYFGAGEYNIQLMPSNTALFLAPPRSG